MQGGQDSFELPSTAGLTERVYLSTLTLAGRERLQRVRNSMSAESQINKVSTAAYRTLHWNVPGCLSQLYSCPHAHVQGDVSLHTAFALETAAKTAVMPGMDSVLNQQISFMHCLACGAFGKTIFVLCMRFAMSNSPTSAQPAPANDSCT